MARMGKQWRSRAGLALIGFLLAALVTTASEKAVLGRKASEIEERLKADLFYLASDDLEGRGPTTRGIDLAADHIAAEFRKAGLKPAGQAGTYFQHFTIPGARLTGAPTLSFAGPNGQSVTPKRDKDFHPLGLSHSGAVKEVGLVFAGYGITADTYDDYQDLKVAGKVVVVLRDAPRFITGNARRKHAALLEKMGNAARRDALGILFVNDADTAKADGDLTKGDDLMDFSFLAAARGATIKIPAFHVKRAVVDRMLADAGLKPLADLEKAINDDKGPQSSVLKDWTASFELSVKRDGIELKNVIGVLEGKGELAKETLVIGAHYDHLGYGGISSLAGLRKMAIHNGADDNASGTTAVIELARRFAADPEREGRRLVFMAFSGEELGLLGSAHYCKNPIFPLADTVAMINLDMVGRLSKNAQSGKERLQVHGVGTAKTFSTLIDEVNKKYDFELVKRPSGFGPSDHSSFYAQKIPVFFFFTGDHPDYHRPSDVADKINYDGLRRITDLTEDLAVILATTPERPEYVRVGGSSAGGPRPSVRLGIRPGYADDGEGVLVEGVSEGNPADKGGIKSGDRIVAMDDKKIQNIEGYMVFMASKKQGDSIEVTVLRDKKEMKLKVKLD